VTDARARPGRENRVIGPTTRRSIGYTLGMDAALVVLVIVVVLVGIDAIGRLDERRDRATRRVEDPVGQTQKIVVDLTGRDLD
jgi:hypothetical protein